MISKGDFLPLNCHKSIAALLVAVLLYETAGVPLAQAAQHDSVWKDRKYASLPVGSLPAVTSALPSKSTPNPIVSKETLRLPLAVRSLVTALPQNRVTVREIFNVNGTRPLVLIQDVHMNPEAQRNIAAAIQALIDQKQITGIAAEGAFGPFKFDESRKLADKNLRAGIADAFVEKKLMGAASVVGISNDATPPIFGVDDRAHYDANVLAYLTTRPLKKKTKKDLQQLKRTLDEEKRAVFSKDLLAFDALRGAHHDGELKFGPYLQKLSALSPDTDLVIEQFLQAYAMESALDFARVEMERRRVVEKLAVTLNGADVTALVDQSLAYRSGQIGFGAYYRELRDLCQKSGIDLRATPAFDNYVRYVLLSDGIKPDQLFDRVRRKEEEVLKLLVRSPAEKELADKIEHARLAEKLIEFELTPDEWAAYRQSMVNRPLSIDQKLSSFESFYEEADIRSEKMVENLVGKGSTALIAGGFHTDQMTALLKQKNIPFIVVSPKLTKISDESGSAYLSEFSREKTPLEKMFLGSKLFVLPAAQNVWAGPDGKVTEVLFDDAAQNPTKPPTFKPKFSWSIIAWIVMVGSALAGSPVSSATPPAPVKPHVFKKMARFEQQDMLQKARLGELQKELSERIQYMHKVGRPDLVGHYSLYGLIVFKAQGSDGKMYSVSVPATRDDVVEGRYKWNSQNRMLELTRPLTSDTRVFEGRTIPESTFLEYQPGQETLRNLGYRLKMGMSSPDLGLADLAATQATKDLAVGLENLGTQGKRIARGFLNAIPTFRAPTLPTLVPAPAAVPAAPTRLPAGITGPALLPDNVTPKKESPFKLASFTKPAEPEVVVAPRQKLATQLAQAQQELAASQSSRSRDMARVKDLEDDLENILKELRNSKEKNAPAFIEEIDKGHGIISIKTKPAPGAAGIKVFKLSPVDSQIANFRWDSVQQRMVLGSLTGLEKEYPFDGAFDKSEAPQVWLGRLAIAELKKRVESAQKGNYRAIPDLGPIKREIALKAEIAGLEKEIVRIDQAEKFTDGIVRLRSVGRDMGKMFSGLQLPSTPLTKVPGLLSQAASNLIRDAALGIKQKKIKDDQRKTIALLEKAGMEMAGAFSWKVPTVKWPKTGIGGTLNNLLENAARPIEAPKPPVVATPPAPVPARVSRINLNWDALLFSEIVLLLLLRLVALRITQLLIDAKSWATFLLPRWFSGSPTSPKVRLGQNHFDLENRTLPDANPPGIVQKQELGMDDLFDGVWVGDNEAKANTSQPANAGFVGVEADLDAPQVALLAPSAPYQLFPIELVDGNGFPILDPNGNPMTDPTTVGAQLPAGTRIIQLTGFNMFQGDGANTQISIAITDASNPRRLVAFGRLPLGFEPPPTGIFIVLPNGLFEDEIRAISVHLDSPDGRAISFNIFGQSLDNVPPGTPGDFVFRLALAAGARNFNGQFALGSFDTTRQIPIVDGRTDGRMVEIRGRGRDFFGGAFEAVIHVPIAAAVFFRNWANSGVVLQLGPPNLGGGGAGVAIYANGAANAIVIYEFSTEPPNIKPNLKLNVSKADRTVTIDFEPGTLQGFEVENLPNGKTTLKFENAKGDDSIEVEVVVKGGKLKASVPEAPFQPVRVIITCENEIKKLPTVRPLRIKTTTKEENGVTPPMPVIVLTNASPKGPVLDPVLVRPVEREIVIEKKTNDNEGDQPANAYMEAIIAAALVGVGAGLLAVAPPRRKHVRQAEAEVLSQGNSSPPRWAWVRDFFEPDWGPLGQFHLLEFFWRVLSGKRFRLFLLLLLLPFLRFVPSPSTPLFVSVPEPKRDAVVLVKPADVPQPIIVPIIPAQKQNAAPQTLPQFKYQFDQPALAPINSDAQLVEARRAEFEAWGKTHRAKNGLTLSNDGDFRLKGWVLLFDAGLEVRLLLAEGKVDEAFRLTQWIAGNWPKRMGGLVTAMDGLSENLRAAEHKVDMGPILRFVATGLEAWGKKAEKGEADPTVFLQLKELLDFVISKQHANGAVPHSAGRGTMSRVFTPEIQLDMILAAEMMRGYTGAEKYGIAAKLAREYLYSALYDKATDTFVAPDDRGVRRETPDAAGMRVSILGKPDNTAAVLKSLLELPDRFVVDWQFARCIALGRIPEAKNEYQRMARFLLGLKGSAYAYQYSGQGDRWDPASYIPWEGAETGWGVRTQKGQSRTAQIHLRLLSMGVDPLAQPNFDWNALRAKVPQANPGQAPFFGRDAAPSWFLEQAQKDLRTAELLKDAIGGMIRGKNSAIILDEKNPQLIQEIPVGQRVPDFLSLTRMYGEVENDAVFNEDGLAEVKDPVRLRALERFYYRDGHGNYFVWAGGVDSSRGSMGQRVWIHDNGKNELGNPVLLSPEFITANASEYSKIEAGYLYLLIQLTGGAIVMEPTPGNSIIHLGHFVFREGALRNPEIRELAETVLKKLDKTYPSAKAQIEKLRARLLDAPARGSRTEDADVLRSLSMKMAELAVKNPPRDKKSRDALIYDLNKINLDYYNARQTIFALNDIQALLETKRTWWNWAIIDTAIDNIEKSKEKVSVGEDGTVLGVDPDGVPVLGTRYALPDPSDLDLIYFRHFEPAIISARLALAVNTDPKMEADFRRALRTTLLTRTWTTARGSGVIFTGMPAAEERERLARLAEKAIGAARLPKPTFPGSRPILPPSVSGRLISVDSLLAEDVKIDGREWFLSQRAAMPPVVGTWDESGEAYLTVESILPEGLRVNGTPVEKLELPLQGKSLTLKGEGLRVTVNQFDPVRGVFSGYKVYFLNNAALDADNLNAQLAKIAAGAKPSVSAGLRVDPKSPDRTIVHIVTGRGEEWWDTFSVPTAKNPESLHLKREFPNGRVEIFSDEQALNPVTGRMQAVRIQVFVNNRLIETRDIVRGADGKPVFDAQGRVTYGIDGRVKFLFETYEGEYLYARESPELQNGIRGSGERTIYNVARQREIHAITQQLVEVPVYTAHSRSPEKPFVVYRVHHDPAAPDRLVVASLNLENPGPASAAPVPPMVQALIAEHKLQIRPGQSPRWDMRRYSLKQGAGFNPWGEPMPPFSMDEREDANGVEVIIYKDGNYPTEVMRQYYVKSPEGRFYKADGSLGEFSEAAWSNQGETLRFNARDQRVRIYITNRGGQPEIQEQDAAGRTAHLERGGLTGKPKESAVGRTVSTVLDPDWKWDPFHREWVAEKVDVKTNGVPDKRAKDLDPKAIFAEIPANLAQALTDVKRAQEIEKWNAITGAWEFSEIILFDNAGHQIANIIPDPLYKQYAEGANKRIIHIADFANNLEKFVGNPQRKFMYAYDPISKKIGNVLFGQAMRVDDVGAIVDLSSHPEARRRLTKEGVSFYEITDIRQGKSWHAFFDWDHNDNPIARVEKKGSDRSLNLITYVADLAPEAQRAYAFFKRDNVVVREDTHAVAARKIGRHMEESVLNMSAIRDSLPKMLEGLRRVRLGSQADVLEQALRQGDLYIYDVKRFYHQDLPGFAETSPALRSLTGISAGYQKLLEIDHERRRVSVNFFDKGSPGAGRLEEPWKQRAGMSFYLEDGRISTALALSVTSEKTIGSSPRLPDNRPRENRQQTFVFDIGLKQAFMEYRQLEDGSVREMKSGRYQFAEDVSEVEQARVLEDRMNRAIKQIEDGDYDGAELTIQEEFLPFSVLEYEYGPYEITLPGGGKLPLNEVDMVLLGIPTFTKAYLYDNTRPSDEESFVPGLASSTSKIFSLQIAIGKDILIKTFRYGVAFHEDKELPTDRIEGTNKFGEKIFVVYGYTDYGGEDLDLRRVGGPGGKGFKPDLVFRVFMDHDNPTMFPNAKYGVADKTMATIIGKDGNEYLSRTSNSSVILPWGSVRYKTRGGISLSPLVFAAGTDEFDQYRQLREDIQDPAKMRLTAVLASFVEEKMNNGFLSKILDGYSHRDRDPVTGYVKEGSHPKFIAFLRYQEAGKSLPILLFHNGVPIGSDRFRYKNGKTDILDYIRPHRNPRLTSNWVESLGKMHIDPTGKFLEYSVDSRLYGGSRVGSRFYNFGTPESDVYRGGRGKPKEIRVVYDRRGLPAVAYGNTDGQLEPWRRFEQGWFNDDKGNTFLIVFSNDSGYEPVLDMFDPRNEWVVYKNGFFLAQYKEGKYLTEEYPTTISLDDLAANSPLGNLAGLVGIESASVKEARNAITTARRLQAESGSDAPASAQGGFIAAEQPEGLEIPASTNLRWERFAADNSPFAIGFGILYSFAAAVWWLLGRGYKKIYSVPVLGRLLALMEYGANGLLLTARPRRYGVNTLDETQLLDLLSSRAAGAVINYRRTHGVVQSQEELRPLLAAQDLPQKEIDWLLRSRLRTDDVDAPGALTAGDLEILRGISAQHEDNWKDIGILQPLHRYVQDLLGQGFLTPDDVFSVYNRFVDKLAPGRITQDLFRQKLMGLLFDAAYWENDRFKPNVRKVMREQSKALYAQLGLSVSDFEIDQLMMELSDLRPSEYVVPLANPIEGPAFGPALWVLENRFAKEGHMGYQPVSLADYVIEYKIIGRWIPFTAFETPYVRWLNRQVKQLLLDGKTPQEITAFVKNQMDLWQLILDDQFNVKFKTMRSIQDRGYYYENRKKREWKYLLIQEEFDDLFLFLMGENEFGPLDLSVLPADFEARRQAAEQIALNGFALPKNYAEAVDRFPVLFADPESNNHLALLLKDTFEEHGFAGIKNFAVEDQAAFLQLLSAIRTGRTTEIESLVASLKELRSQENDKVGAEKFIHGIVRRFEIQKVVDEKIKPFVLGVRKAENIPGYYQEKGAFGIRKMVTQWLLLNKRFWNGKGPDAGTARAARAKFFAVFTIFVWLVLASVVALHTFNYAYQLPLPGATSLGGWEIFLVPLSSLLFTAIAMVPIFYMMYLTYSGVSFLHKGMVRLFIRYKYRMVTAKTYALAVDFLPAMFADPTKGADHRRRFLKTIEQVYKERRLTLAERDGFRDLVRLIEERADSHFIQKRLRSLKHLTSSDTEKSFLRMINRQFRLDVPETPESLRQLVSTTFMVTALNDNPWEFFDDLNRITQAPGSYESALNFLKGQIAGDKSDPERVHRFKLAVAEEVEKKFLSTEIGDLLWNLADKKDVDATLALLKAQEDKTLKKLLMSLAETYFAEAQSANELETGIGQVAYGYPDQYDVLLDHLKRLVESGDLAQAQWDELASLKTNRRWELESLKNASLGTATGRAQATAMIEEWVNMKKNAGLYNIVSAMRSAEIVIDDSLEKLFPGNTPEILARRQEEKERLLQPIHSFAQYNFDLQDYFRKKTGNVQLDINEFINTIHHDFLRAKSQRPALTVREFLSVAVRDQSGQGRFFDDLLSKPADAFVTQGGIAKGSEKKSHAKMLKVLEAAIEYNIVLAQGYLAENIITDDPAKKNTISNHEKSSVGLEKYSSWKGNGPIVRGQLLMAMDIDHYHLIEEMWALPNVMQQFNVNSKFGIAPYHTIISNKSLSGVAGGMGIPEEGWILGEQATLQEIARVFFYGKGFLRVSFMRRGRGAPQEKVAEDTDGAMNMVAMGIMTGSINYLATNKLLPALYLGALVPLYKWSGDSSELAYGVNGFKYWYSPHVPWYEKLGMLRSSGFYQNKPWIERVTGLVILIFYVFNLNPWFGLPMLSIFVSVMIMQAICYAGYMVFAEGGKGYVGSAFAFAKAFFSYLFIFATGITPRYSDASNRGYAKFADFIRTGGRAGVSKREKPIDLYMATQYGVKRGFLLTMVVLLSPFALGKFLIWIFQIMTVSLGWWMSPFLLNPAENRTAWQKAKMYFKNWSDGIVWGGFYGFVDTLLHPVAGAVLIWRYGHLLFGPVPSFKTSPKAALQFVFRIYVVRPLVVLMVGGLDIASLTLIRMFNLHQYRLQALDESIYSFTRNAMGKAKKKKMDEDPFKNPDFAWLTPIMTASQYSLKGYLRGRIPGLPSTVALFAITSRAVALNDKIDRIDKVAVNPIETAPWKSPAAIGRNLGPNAGFELNQPVALGFYQQRIAEASFDENGELTASALLMAAQYFQSRGFWQKKGADDKEPIWEMITKWALRLVGDEPFVKQGRLALIVPELGIMTNNNAEPLLVYDRHNPRRLAVGHSGFGGRTISDGKRTAYFNFRLIEELFLLHARSRDDRASELSITRSEIERLVRLMLRHEFQHLDEREKGNADWEDHAEVTEVLSLLAKARLISMNDEEFQAQEMALRLRPLEDGIVSLTLNEWGLLSKADQERLLAQIIDRNHRAESRRAVVLDAPLAEGRPVRIRLVPREILLDGVEDMNRAINDAFLLQRATARPFFKIYSDTSVMKRLLAPLIGRGGQFVNFVVNQALMREVTIEAPRGVELFEQWGGDPEKALAAYRQALREVIYRPEQVLELKKAISDDRGKSRSRSARFPWQIAFVAGALTTVASFLAVRFANADAAWMTGTGFALSGPFALWAVVETIHVLARKFARRNLDPKTAHLLLGRTVNNLLPLVPNKNVRVRLAAPGELGWLEIGRQYGNMIVVHPAFADDRSVVAHELFHFNNPSSGRFWGEVRARMAEHRALELSPGERRTAQRLGRLLPPVAPLGLREFGDKAKQRPRRVIDEAFAAHARGDMELTAAFLAGGASMRNVVKVAILPESEDLDGIINDFKVARNSVAFKARSASVMMVLNEPSAMVRKALDAQNVPYMTRKEFDEADADTLLAMPNGGRANMFRFAYAAGSERPDDFWAVMNMLKNKLKGEADFDMGMLTGSGVYIKRMSIEDLMRQKLFEKAVADSQA